MIGPQLTVHAGLFDWFVRNPNASVPGFARAYFSGLTTLEASNIIARIISDFPELKGIYHLSGGERIDKYSLLHLIKEQYDLPQSITIERNEDLVVDRSLDDGCFRRATGIAAKGWQTMLREMHARSGQRTGSK